MCWVAEGQGGEGVALEESGEDLLPGGIMRVNIRIAPDVDRDRGVVLHQGGQHHGECGEGGEELGFAAAGGQVHTYVGGRSEARDGEEERQDSRGGGGQDGDVRVQGGVPHGEGPAPGAALVQAEGVDVGVLAVEVKAVAREGSEGEGHVALEGLWLGEEYEAGVVLGCKGCKARSTAASTLNIPADYSNYKSILELVIY
jgi:hypothetical protein